MIKVGCVVLNYKNYQETIKCVESLLIQADVEIEIAIVDNGSGNESIQVLQDRFRNCSNCHIIESYKNLGFAKGNNLGISFLKKMGVNYIWVTNSDTIFTDEYITRDAIAAYRSGIGIINVTSYLMDGRKNYYVCYKKKLVYLRMIKSFAIAFKDAFVRKNKKIVFNQREELLEDEIKELNRKANGECNIHTEEYIITGSVFLLTEDFLCNYGGLFPETFFYCEETATILFLHKAGLKTAMVNTGVVLHKHRASTSKNNMKNYGLESRRKILKLFFMSKKQIIKKYFR